MVKKSYFFCFLFLFSISLIGNAQERTFYDEYQDQFKVETLDGRCSVDYQGIGWTNECHFLLFEKHFGTEIATLIQDQFYNFQNAIKNKDKVAVANMVYYPITIYYTPKGTSEAKWPRPLTHKIFKNKDEFMNNYSFIFNSNFVHYILESKFMELCYNWNYFGSYFPFASFTFALKCDGEIHKPPFDTKNNCKNPEVKIDYMNNDAVREGW